MLGQEIACMYLLENNTEVSENHPYTLWYRSSNMRLENI